MQRAPEAPENGPPETLPAPGQMEAGRALSARAEGSRRRAGTEGKLRRAFRFWPSPSPRAGGRCNHGERAARGDRRWEDWQPERRVAGRAGVRGERWACGTRRRPIPDRCGFADSSGSEKDNVPPPMVRRPFAGRRNRHHGSERQARADNRAGRCQGGDRGARCHRAVRRSGHALQGGVSTTEANARPSAVTRRGHQRTCTVCQLHRPQLRGLQTGSFVASCTPIISNLIKQQ